MTAAATQHGGPMARGGTADFSRIGEALSFIDPADRETWVRMAMAVKSEAGDAGFDLWDGWGQGADSYNAADSRDVWRSVKVNGGTSIGTLFFEAKRAGWRDDETRPQPTQEELAERDRAAKVRAAADQAKGARERARAAGKAALIWGTASSADSNPYLARKAAAPTETLREIQAGTAAELLGYHPKSGGEPLAGPLLVVPVKVGDLLTTLELIDGDGRKAALYGGAKKAGYWASGALPEGDGTGATLLIGEGAATALSAKEATGHPAVAALSAGNLAAVARAMRGRYPKARLVLLADLVKATGAPDPHVIEAAAAVGGLLAVPDFGPDRPATAKDMNDLAQARGPAAVRLSIEAASAMADGATLAGVARWETPAGLQGLHKGCSETAAKQGCIPVSPETLQKYVADQIGPAGPDAAAGHCPDVADDDPRNGMQFSRVAGVAGDTTNNRKGSACNPDATPGVSGVAGNEPRPIPGAADRPAFRVFDDWTEANKAKFRPGVWFFGTDKDGMLTQTWICSPLYLDAVTFDGQDNNFGRLLRFRNTLGRWRQWAMPMDLLAGLGNEIRGELLAMGVEIDPTTKARALLATYLQAGPPKRRMRAALEVGWCGGSFVLPDAVIGPDAAGVIFQSGERGHDEYTRAGTLVGWRAEVAALAVGNPMLTMGMSASFAGPLLGRTNAEGGGLHFWGDSSTGKSAILDAACSTWGGPNYRRSWRATANGMEGAASLFNDCLLALDEISECDPREVGAIVYSLGNGRGKQRSSRTGAARSVSRWRCFIVSNGERTIATTMLEGGHRVKAGQGARLLDLPAARTFGAWDDLHGMPNGAAFSDALKRAAVTHHGHAGRAFLGRLTRDPRDFAALLDEFKGLPSFAAEAGEGQEKRVAGRFALLALAGELATEYGVTGWPEGEATKAAAEGFRAWGAHRGKGNDERRQILDRVQAFIERHGDARFSAADATGEGLPTRDRAGWWRTTVEGRQYLFTADGMREATRGFDLRRALDVLEAAGALPPAGADGKRAVSQRINGRPMRLYPVAADKLGDCDGD